MNASQASLALLIFWFSGILSAQVQPFDTLRPGTSISNVRVGNQSRDGTEATLIMDVSYDGSRGSTAVLIPKFEKKGQKEVSSWFGADPVTIGQGKGTISIKAKYFNDEPGVPTQLTTDTIRVLVLNDSRSAILSGSTVLKTIKWGSAQGTPKVQPASTTTSGIDPSSEQTRAQEALRQAAAAEAKAQAELLEREKARVAAEAEAKRLESEKLKAEAEARRLGELKASQEAAARQRELERQQAEADARAQEKLRIDAETKARAEAAAREQARLKAEAETIRLAQEQKKAEEKARLEAETKEKQRLAAEAKKRDEERLKSLEEARRLAEERKKAEALELEAAQLRENARLKAAAEAKKKADEEAQAKAEAARREEARLKAEAEVSRLAEEQKQAALKANAEREARRRAEDKARQEEQAKARAEEAAKAAAFPNIPTASQPAPLAGADPMAVTAGAKSKVTNVDVVNRSVDRTQMTIGVEFEYKDDLGPKPMLGVQVARSGDPKVSEYFHSQPAEIGKSRRNFALFPVKFQPPASESAQWPAFATDKVMVYLSESAGGRRLNLFPATMMLLWKAPGSTFNPATAAQNPNHVQLEDFKQNDFFSAQLTVRYRLEDQAGKIRVNVVSAAHPTSSKWFEDTESAVKGGRGIQILKIGVSPTAAVATDVFKADAIVIELLDQSGKVVATERKESPMNWAKPK